MSAPRPPKGAKHSATGNGDAYSRTERIVVTGTGAVCASGRSPESILDAIVAGKSAIAPIAEWDTTGWPCRAAAAIVDLNPREMVDDRKLHKLIRRSDLFGLYAAGAAIERAGLVAFRDGLDVQNAAAWSDRTGVYVGSGGGTYANQYDYFPLLQTAHGDLATFGRELGDTVNPMWLLRSLPNNVLGHIGIKYGFKGSNACITNHSVSGALAVLEALEALRNAEADRVVAVGHDAPIDPQTVLYYGRVGLTASDSLRPFDARHDGSIFGEGAAALCLETESSAKERGATIVGEVLGGGAATEGEGLLAIRDDGDGVARALALALDDAGMSTSDVGMIVAHGNGTPQSDASEAAAIRRVFGTAPPPVTAFKWAFGHLLAAAGAIDAVLALAALARGIVPGIAAFTEAEPLCRDVPVSRTPQEPRSATALVISRGFAGTDAALVVRSR
jgi:3-oxoacyl-[acyl-carrier-protein] synthase-1